MATETVRVRLRRKLEGLVGVDEADLLMDRPPGGWSDLVTNERFELKLGALGSRTDARFDAVDARFDAFEARTDARFDAVDTRFDALEDRMRAGFEIVDHQFAALRFELRAEIADGFRAQTWRLMTAMIGLVASMMALCGVLVAAVRA